MVVLKIITHIDGDGGSRTDLIWKELSLVDLPSDSTEDKLKRHVFSYLELSQNYDHYPGVSVKNIYRQMF